MGERLTKGQKISDGKRSGGGEREKRLQLSRDERGQRVRAGGTQQGGGAKWRRRGRGAEGQSSGIICTVTLQTSFASVNRRTRVKLCRCGTGRCCVVVVVSD